MTAVDKDADAIDIAIGGIAIFSVAHVEHSHVHRFCRSRRNLFRVNFRSRWIPNCYLSTCFCGA